VTSAILEVEHVRKAFGGVVANKDVSVSVPAGKIYGLIGPNGSGKTTLFNCIVGQHPVDGGAIRFEGRDISRLGEGQLRPIRRRMQMVFQDPFASLNPRHSVGRIVRAAEDLLHFVGLHPKRNLRAGDLSFGQQKLLEFAMALMSKPKMLLLDEPTAGINPTLIKGLLQRLREANREFGITLLVIEHNMRVIMELAEYIYCLAHGELLAHGKPEQIQTDQRVLDAYLGAH